MFLKVEVLEGMGLKLELEFRHRKRWFTNFHVSVKPDGEISATHDLTDEDHWSLQAELKQDGSVLFTLPKRAKFLARPEGQRRELREFIAAAGLAD